MGLTKISTDGVKDDAVTTDKLADAINTERTANTAKVSLEADSVTGAKIADDAVGAEHIEQLDADLSFADGAKAKFGAGNDLEIYHGGSHSYISDTGIGGLKILASDFYVNNAADDENMIKALSDGAVELYHNNTKHFETQTNGVKIDSGGDTILEMHTSNGTAHSRIQFSNNSGDNYGGIWYSAGNIMEFRANDAERFRIVNTTLRSVGQASDFTAKGISLEESSVGGRLYVGRDNNDSVAEFHRSGTRVGTISVNSSNTSYNTSSDYRLKENVVGISDGITRLKKLKPSRFNFKIDKDTTVDGFLAHEVTPAVPEAITGTKDETQDILYTEEDTIPSGKKVGDVKETVPKYQGIDQSKLVPLLTAALQEAVAKIEVLETKVAALEAA